MNDFIFSPFMIPIAGMIMVVAIVFIRGHQRSNEEENESRHTLRLREMEHEQKMKEMELELAKVQAGKANSGSTGNS